MDKEILAKRIRRQREELSLTREQFAERVDISPQFLAEIENNTKGMSAETLYKICDKLELSADYILLGRQSTKGIQTPAVALLDKIPSEYSEEVEDILRAYLTTIIKVRGES